MIWQMRLTQLKAIGAIGQSHQFVFDRPGICDNRKMPCLFCCVIWQDGDPLYRPGIVRDADECFADVYLGPTAQIKFR